MLSFVLGPAEPDLGPKPKLDNRRRHTHTHTQTDLTFALLELLLCSEKGLAHFDFDLTRLDLDVGHGTRAFQLHICMKCMMSLNRVLVLLNSNRSTNQLQHGTVPSENKLSPDPIN